MVDGVTIITHLIIHNHYPISTRRKTHVTMLWGPHAAIETKLYGTPGRASIAILGIAIITSLVRSPYSIPTHFLTARGFQCVGGTYPSIFNAACAVTTITTVCIAIITQFTWGNVDSVSA